MNIKDIKSLDVVHVNSYGATIDLEDISSFKEDEVEIVITFKNDYQFEDNGSPRWKSIEPLDKDEITCFVLNFADGEVKNIAVPFEDVSPNGAYCVNSKSHTHEKDNYITIEWHK